MNDISKQRERIERWGRRVRLAVMLSCSVTVLSGCDSLLDVNLPAKLTDAALEDPQGAQTIRNSVIGEFETAFNFVVWSFHGMEGGGEIPIGSPGIDNGGFNYQLNPERWFPFLHSSRRFAQLLHDKLQSEWTVAEVPERGRFMATSSIYEGAAVALLGMAMCEVTLNTSALMTSGETMTLADQLLTRAISEIDAVGDFPIPFSIASSAKEMALGLRAQVRWANGDLAAASQDAQLVSRGFKAWVTRDVGPQRRNKPYFDGTVTRYAYLFDVNDWWTADPTKAPGAETNPVTGERWADVIPFTGYQNLGIMPDGRAVWDDTGLPVRVDAGADRPEGKYRQVSEATAVPDTRVSHGYGATQGQSLSRYFNLKYKSEASPLPLVNWVEMVLIRAEAVGGQGAIDLVNDLRAEEGLPLVTYADPGNSQQIRYMIIEERRRALFVEGRYYFTKLKNLDLLWFPRDEGQSGTRRTQYSGAVRLIMPDREYELNPNLSLSDRGTGCPLHERPVSKSL